LVHYGVREFANLGYLTMGLRKIIKQCRVNKPDRFHLRSHDPSETFGLSIDKNTAKPLLEDGIRRLAELQQKLYAESRWALLIIFQGMDAAGKDSAIKHVMSGVNPQGCEVHSFKAPSDEELDHSFLWRASIRLPARGRIGIFNRSYYEEVLITRVHPELLEHERLPNVDKQVWKHRFADIRAFERHLTRNGVVVLKFYLHLSQEEQRRRLLARLDVPSKRWKFSMSDVKERRRWDKYMAAYEDMISNSSTDEAPWHVIPANNRWLARIVVAATIIETLDGLDLKFPVVKGKALTELKKVRRALLAERGSYNH
jgi:PPK2 family polyphosphate:nucleotide phosphotransferase